MYKQRRKLYDEFWALRNVSLDIHRGETLGLIGKNGSGKSTLLQLIAGTLTPTTGSIDTNGRISAILELGAGFNPEFTGTENARLNASILGMSRDEIGQRLPAIAEFSELGDFIDRPVKTYSSGMYIRLAFSICISMAPDILIIDEALAVGDVKFQRKCFRKLEQLRSDGVTILFVTHATDSVIGLCDRAILLDGGEVKCDGEPKDVVNRYLESVFTPDQNSNDVAEAPRDRGVIRRDLQLTTEEDSCLRRATYNGSEYRWGNGGAKIFDYLLNRDNGQELSTDCAPGEVLSLLVAVRFYESVHQVVYGLTIKTIDGAVVYGTNSEMKQTAIAAKAPGRVCIVEFGFSANLLPGEYFISLGVVEKERSGADRVLDRRYDLIHMRVRGEKKDGFGVAAVNMTVGEHEQ